MTQPTRDDILNAPAIPVPEADAPQVRVNAARGGFSRKHSVGVDISGDTVHVAEVKPSGGRYQILRAGSAPIAKTADGDSNATQLAAAITAALSAAGIRRRRIVINLPGDPFECFIEQLPKMPCKELEAVARRTSQSRLGDDAAWDYYDLSHKSDDVLHVMRVTAPGAALAECMKAAAEARLSVDVVTPPEMAAVLALNAPKDTTRALVHVGRQAVAVVIISNDKPMLARRIHLDAEPGDNALFVAQEVNRTILYFKQQCRGARVAEALCIGADEHLLGTLNEELDMKVHDLAGGLFAERSGGYSPTAAVLALAGMREAGINLLPVNLKERRSLRSRLSVLIVAASASAVIYGACLGALGTARLLYADALKTLDTQLELFTPVHEAFNEIQQNKREMRVKQRTEQQLNQLGLPLPYLLWRMATLLPPDVQLGEMSTRREGFLPGRAEWSMRIAGTIASGDRSSEALAQVLANLQDSGLFDTVRLEPINQRSSGPLAFVVRCTLKPLEQWTPMEQP